MSNSISVEIVIRVSPEEVFRAWTDPGEFVAWWGDDETYRTTGLESDLRPGGRWKSVGVTKEGQPFEVGGEYVTVNPPHELSFTWTPGWEPELRSTVELEFLPVPEGTRLVLRHSGFTSDESRNGHNEGWGRVLGWLKSYKENEG